MTKIFLILSFIVAIATFSTAKAESFEANDLAIEQTFQNSTEVTSNNGLMMNMMTAATANATHAEFKGGDKSAVIAFLLCTVYYFIGVGGLHRFYMGTATLTGVGYILTLGGCGVVQLVDWVLLLIGMFNGDISKYTDNRKFFMW